MIEAQLIAVEGFDLEIVPAIPDGTTGTVSATTVFFDKIHFDGRGVAKTISVSISGVTAPGAGATTPDPGPYTGDIIPKGEKARSESIFLLHEGDETGPISATPKIPGSPPTPYPTTFKIRIKTAGQDKVKSK